MPQLAESPSLDTGWAIGEQKFHLIVEHISQDPVNILEFGSGVSTARFAQEYPTASIVSVDQDAGFAQQTRELLQGYGLCNASVVHCPLAWKRSGLRLFRTYDLDTPTLRSAIKNESVDFVLVDGPVEAQAPRGREGALYQVFDLIKVGGLIALDDCRRESARAAIGNWLAVYGDSLTSVVETKDLIILQKQAAHAGAARAGIQQVIDNWNVNATMALRFIRRRIAGMRTGFQGNS